ncbi:hypothetical protein ACYUFO_002193 [Vibrio parahaemolyticus]
MSGNFLKPLEVMDNGNFGFITDDSGTPSITVSSVSINEALNLLLLGESGALTATVTYSDSSEVNSVDNPNVVDWNSSDELILTVDSTGVYSAIGLGDVAITSISTEDITIFDSISLTVLSADEGWFIMTAAEIVSGDVNGFTASKGAIRPIDVNGGTILALEANIASGFIRVTINTDAIGVPFSTVTIVYQEKTYAIPFTTGYRYELHDPAQTQTMFDDLQLNVDIESSIKITAVTMTDEEYEQYLKSRTKDNQKPNFILVDGDIKNSG